MFFFNIVSNIFGIVGTRYRRSQFPSLNAQVLPERSLKFLSIADFNFTASFFHAGPDQNLLYTCLI
jgi:hypothetical protein